MKPPDLRRLSRLAKAESRDAFSLVEIVIALGILSFAVLSILGLLPLSLKYARESMEISQKAKAAQRIGSELLQSKFEEVIAQPQRVWIYNYDGVEVDKDDPSAHYWVAATLEQGIVPSKNMGTGLDLKNIIRVNLTITTRSENIAGLQKLGQTVLTIPYTGYGDVSAM